MAKTGRRRCPLVPSSCFGFPVVFGVLLLNLTGYQPYGSLLIGSFGLGFCSVPRTPLRPKVQGSFSNPAWILSHLHSARRSWVPNHLKGKLVRLRSQKDIGAEVPHWIHYTSHVSRRMIPCNSCPPKFSWLGLNWRITSMRRSSCWVRIRIWCRLSDFGRFGWKALSTMARIFVNIIAMWVVQLRSNQVFSPLPDHQALHQTMTIGLGKRGAMTMMKRNHGICWYSITKRRKWKEYGWLTSPSKCLRRATPR